MCNLRIITIHSARISYVCVVIAIQQFTKSFLSKLVACICFVNPPAQQMAKIIVWFLSFSYYSVI